MAIDKSNYQIIKLPDSEYNDEIIAVIAAAIADSLNRSTHSIIVRSIKFIPDVSPVWNRAARRDLTTPWY